jgi:hypothetical protein
MALNTGGLLTWLKGRIAYEFDVLELVLKRQFISISTA